VLGRPFDAVEREVDQRQLVLHLAGLELGVGRPEVREALRAGDNGRLEVADLPVVER
jgi:hypothetical protein